MKPEPNTDEWRAQVIEPVIEPSRRIIDPHHHLWKRENRQYLLPELRVDTGSGHRVEKTVFVECGAHYRTTGPEHLRCLGESAFVAEQSEKSQDDSGQVEIAGIVPFADLTLEPGLLGEVLMGHEEIAGDRLVGIRHAGAFARYPQELMLAPPRQIKGLYQNLSFVRGLKQLAHRGLVYDTWHYHYQNRDFAALARRVPEARLVLNHFGTPIGVGRYASQKRQIFEMWKEDIRELSQCPNVIVKLGGLAMPDNGFGWHLRELPATSDELVAAHKGYFLHAIDCFGVDRCMFESNFPVDRRSVSYRVLFNAFKKMVSDFSATEKHRLFFETAVEVYGLNDNATLQE
ncbi:MAG: amidohydrolase family protein [Pseudomonadota bacterium]